MYITMWESSHLEGEYIPKKGSPVHHQVGNFWSETLFQRPVLLQVTNGFNALGIEDGSHLRHADAFLPNRSE